MCKHGRYIRLVWTELYWIILCSDYSEQPNINNYIPLLQLSANYTGGFTYLFSSVANSVELQGAANSAPTLNNCSEGAQFVFKLKSAGKSKLIGRYLGIVQWNTHKYQYWAPTQLERVNIWNFIFRSIQVVIHCQTSHLDRFGVTF